MMGFVVGFGALIIARREDLERSVAKKKAAAAPKKKKKAQMSVPESFAFLAKNTYIQCMATLVVCYGICINLVEVTWKSKLKVFSLCHRHRTHMLCAPVAARSVAVI